MDLSDNTALVTGGASGIGLAIAARLLEAGSRVIICGRREEKLREAAAAHPGLQTRVCDLARASERESLFTQVTSRFPQLNLLVNNAGIQRRIQFRETEPWEQTREEIAVNLEAPIHLSLLFLPHLRNRKRAAIVNVTSGLAFTPVAGVPVYCATKAALHSFTLSLRHQLAGESVRVVEIIPPSVNTDLGGPGLHNYGAPLGEFADAVTERLAAGEVEIAYGTAEAANRAAHGAFDEAIARMNPMFVEREG
jgi:uncharacterized oxidoreductase